MAYDPIADFDSLTNLSPRRKSARPKKPKYDEESLLKSIGHKALSGLQLAGDVLDTPGSMVRAGLVGKNPLTGVLNPDERTSGRDVLEHYGVLGKNKPGFDAGDVAGFIAGEALNPATYLTFGGSALSKGGQVAKAAELLKKTTRVKRMTTTLDDLVKAGGAEAAEKAGRAAKGLGVDAAKVGGEKLGGLVGMGLPFKEASFAIGTGPKSQRIAGALDKAGSAIRGSAPVRLVRQGFDASVEGASSKLGQEYGEQLHAAKRANRATAKEQTAELLQGPLRTAEPVQLRRTAENVEPALPQHAPHVSLMQNTLESNELKLRRGGASSGKRPNYFPRQATPTQTGGAASAKFFSTDNPSRWKRAPFLNDLPEGTSTIQTVAMDPAINAAIKGGADRKALAKLIESRYGDATKPHYLPPTYLRKEGKEMVEKNRYHAVAQMLLKTPEESRAKGIFGNHPVFDYETKALRDADAQSVMGVVSKALAEHAKPVSGAAPKGTVTLGDVLRSAKLRSGLEGIPKEAAHYISPDDGEGALFEIARLRGQKSVTHEMLRERVPAGLAEDLKRFRKGFSGPETAHAIVRGLDSLTNLFKVGVLNWPARYVRDLTSGQFQNATAGMFHPEDLRGAATLLTGGEIKDLAKNPAVGEMLKKAGLPATDAGAKALVQRLAYAHDVVGQHAMQQAQVGQQLAQRGAGNLDEMLAGLPGETPFSGRRVANKFMAREPGTTLNPLDIRGVETPKGGLRTETKFGPAAAGNDLGYMTDSLNRLAPFINQLKKGVDPAEAAARIRAAQIDYGSEALTKFEREAMARLFPFYRFSRGVLPYTLKELTEKPGGRMATTIKAANRATNDEAMPDYLAGNVAVPIPAGTPLIGPKAGADPRYLTGLGLMFEDPLNALGGARHAGLELLSRMNPAIKGPLEFTTGQSFFQRGPHGGRPLDDLDPMLGRLIANIRGEKEAVHYPGEKLLEPALANSPASRVLSTARTLSDRRKSATTKAVNLLTGLRLTDIPPRAREAVLRDLAEEELLSLPGSRRLVEGYLPADRMEALSPSDRDKAERAMAALDILAARRRERKKTMGAGAK